MSGLISNLKCEKKELVETEIKRLRNKTKKMVKRSETSQRFWVAFSLDVYTKLIPDGAPQYWKFNLKGFPMKSCNLLACLPSLQD